ncbi:hypothetical protein QVD17_29354 [Tagetes erecta]|uniref:TFIIS N-terminal domain-containing protein n=1 Tax=Tagetes erecta TaxID=13708 RepID=A0AAD8KBN1_TARER|nr:hypothetical protein QVD17_29354 [Tagetes erecta]
MGSEFLRIKSMLDDVHEPEDETKTIAEVLRIKAILDDSGYKSEGVLLCELLKKLKQKVVSMKVLEATMIGKSVSRFGHHASKDVRHAARTLVVSWRRIVDEWMIVNDHNMTKEECVGSNKNNVPTITKRPTNKRPPVVPRKINNVVLEKRCFTRDDKINKGLTRAHVPCASVKTPAKSTVSMTFDKNTIEEKIEATKRKMKELYTEAKTRSDSEEHK